MSMAQIRERYGVPAKPDAEVTFRGERCRIVAARGHHLHLRSLVDDRKIGPCHPLWEMDYGDGIDHGAAYDARVDAFVDGLNAPRPGDGDFRCEGCGARGAMAYTADDHSRCECGQEHARTPRRDVVASREEEA